MGTRFDRDARCQALALEMVEKWLENSPALPPDIERIKAFDELGCSDVFLEVERQRILRGEVEPWVRVSR